MQVTAIIVAAGSGTRAGAGIAKQFRPLCGRAVLAHTLAKFTDHRAISDVVIVHSPDDLHHIQQALGPDHGAILAIGGATRSASVAAGLDAAPAGTTHVLVHDGARPLVTEPVISGVVEALATAQAAAPGIAVTDALWRVDGAQIQAPQDRENLVRAQTPQGFAIEILRAAHGTGSNAADDVALVLAQGIDVTWTTGDADNIKLTYAADFARAERILAKGSGVDIRLGNGYDVHRFGEGDHVVLCGVPVPFSRGLQGHSDADVGMHAVTDAIYGALAMGDIGQHFPPSDPQWKGAASEIFLRHAVELARENGFSIGNVDCTLVCEFPKIGPVANDMRAAMAAIMGMDVDRISIKATTSERLGFTGRGEGIAAIATATLVKP